MEPGGLRLMAGGDCDPSTPEMGIRGLSCCNEGFRSANKLAEIGTMSVRFTEPPRL